jgi:hypothetical protein
MTVQQQAHRELVEAVARAYGRRLSVVTRWPPETVRVMHRKAIDLGFIQLPAEAQSELEL